MAEKSRDDPKPYRLGAASHVPGSNSVLEIFASGVAGTNLGRRDREEVPALLSGSEITIGRALHLGVQLGRRDLGSIRRGGVAVEVEGDPLGVDVECHGAYRPGPLQRLGQGAGGQRWAGHVDQRNVGGDTETGPG